MKTQFRKSSVLIETIEYKHVLYIGTFCLQLGLIKVKFCSWKKLNPSVIHERLPCNVMVWIFLKRVIYENFSIVIHIFYLMLQLLIRGILLQTRRNHQTVKIWNFLDDIWAPLNPINLLHALLVSWYQDTNFEYHISEFYFIFFGGGDIKRDKPITNWKMLVVPFCKEVGSPFYFQLNLNVQ